MENKKITELLDLLTSLISKDGDLKDGYEETSGELKNREPFCTILKNDITLYDETLEGRIEYLEEQVRLLKRHKHELNTGDIMIRI